MNLHIFKGIAPPVLTYYGKLRTNCLSVFGHFDNLTLKGLKENHTLRAISSCADLARSNKLRIFRLDIKSKCLPFGRVSFFS